LGFADDFNSLPLAELMRRLNEPSSERQFLMYEALRKGAGVKELYEKTYIKDQLFNVPSDYREMPSRQIPGQNQLTQ